MQAAGFPTCLCLTEIPMTKYDCTYDFNVNGKCVSLTGISQNFTYAAGDFGTSCKIWWDPTAACMDITQYPPDWKPLSEQADWCQRPWCYVDPCNCDVADATKSDYFPGEVFYSYATCGEKNTFVGVASATNTVGNAECTSAAAEPASDAHSLNMGFGLLIAALMAALAWAPLLTEASLKYCIIQCVQCLFSCTLTFHMDLCPYEIVLLWIA